MGVQMHIRGQVVPDISVKVGCMLSEAGSTNKTSASFKVSATGLEGARWHLDSFKSPDTDLTVELSYKIISV